MKKRLQILLLILVLASGVGWAGSAYFSFVSHTIFDESTSHLVEIFRQANQTLYNLVSVNWDRMSMWTPYLDVQPSEQEIVAYVNRAREKSGFTDFFFISRNGDYITLDGHKGYLDLQDQLTKLILDKQPVVVNSVVPDQPEIMVFAIPSNQNSFRGFTYEAIAITFNNSDLVEALQISAFGGQASTYAVLPDGRVVLDNSSESMQDVRNVFALLDKAKGLTDEKLAALKDDFRLGNSGEMVFDVDENGKCCNFEAKECTITSYNKTAFDKLTTAKQKDLKKAISLAFAKEAYHVMKKMPAWTLGALNGKPVKTKCNQTITYYLR